MRDDEGRSYGAVTLLEDITHLREIDRVTIRIHRHRVARIEDASDERPDS
ncbi:MAG: hypothetical protein WKF84_13475 [Pyrinomonadaceae bacterium]